MGRRAKRHRRPVLRLAHPAEGIALSVAGLLVAAALWSGYHPSQDGTTVPDMPSAVPTQAPDNQDVASYPSPLLHPSPAPPVGTGVTRKTPDAEPVRPAAPPAGSASPTPPSTPSPTPAPVVPVPTSPSSTPSRPPTSSPVPLDPPTSSDPSAPADPPTSSPPVDPPTGEPTTPGESPTGEPTTPGESPTTGQAGPDQATGAAPGPSERPSVDEAPSGAASGR